MRWYNKGWIIKDEAVVCVSRINETVVIWEGSSVKYGVCWWGGCPRGGPPSPPHPSIYSILHVGEKSQRCIVLTSSLATDTHLLKYWYEEENECLEYNLNIWMFYVREQQLIDKKKKRNIQKCEYENGLHIEEHILSKCGITYFSMLDYEMCLLLHFCFHYKSTNIFTINMRS